MSIRRERLAFEDGYVQVPNAWARDGRISHKARGLLLELLSHRPGWQVTVEALVKAGPDGRDAVQTGLRELVQHGYLVRVQEHDEGGQFSPVDYLLQDPWSGPQTDYPSADNPSAGNPHPKKTITQKTKEQAAQPAAADHEHADEHAQMEATDAALMPAAEDVVLQAWTSRLQAAGAGKVRPLTTQQRAALRKHLRSGVTPERMVQVIGWAFTDPRGVFWRPKLSTWSAVLKHWATMHMQCPSDWREQVPLDLWHQQQDAALLAAQAAAAVAARAAYGLTQEAWDALPADDRADLMSVAAAPSVPETDYVLSGHVETPAAASWDQEQQRALVRLGWD